MIIDLKDTFYEIKKANEAERYKGIEEEYAKKYIQVREDLSKNKFCNIINFKYSISQKEIIIDHENSWNSIQILASDIYNNLNDEEKLLSIKEYIKKVCLSVDKPPKIINDYLLNSVGEEYEPYFNILMLIESSMVKIAEFREEYVNDIENDLYVFTSYLDLITTGDYLRLSLIEDFLLETGAFTKENLND